LAGGYSSRDAAETGRFAKVGSEEVVQRRHKVSTRVLAVLALLAPAALATSGCSPGVSYPSIFPAVEEAPPPRADTPMDPNQVQQATESLISDRERLSAEAQGNGPMAPSTGAKKPSGNAARNGSSSVVSGDAQTAGAETK